MGFFRTLGKSIEYLTMDNIDMAKQWDKDHPALTFEEELCRARFINGGHFYKNESMSEYTVERDNATSRFIDECKMINDQYPYLSEEELRSAKISRYKYLKECDISYGYIKYEFMMRIIDDTSPSRMKAEAEQREANHFTIEKAKKYAFEIYDKSISKDNKKKKK